MYFQHPAYDAYPVVNVTKEGALLYCAWLTGRYNASAKVKVRFALPDEEQWMRAAQGGDAAASYPWHGNTLTCEKKGKWYHTDMCNYKHNRASADTKAKTDVVDITAPSESFLPNAYGIYNMSGNVAEMLSDAHYTKGGSWYSGADHLSITSHEDWTDANSGRPDIGFRPVMMMAEEQ